MFDLILLALALWIVSHTISMEIPATRDGPKPFSCQLCLSGWAMLGTCAGLALGGGVDFMGYIAALAVWALAVFLEALYQRLHTFIL